MEHVNINQLRDFINLAVDIAILDEEGGEKSPVLQKTIKKLEHCPDHTHLRIYFDDFYFLAVPLTATVEQYKNHWVAFDQSSGLKYDIRKVCIAHE